MNGTNSPLSADAMAMGAKNTLTYQMEGSEVSGVTMIPKFTEVHLADILLSNISYSMDANNNSSLNMVHDDLSGVIILTREQEIQLQLVKYWVNGVVTSIVFVLGLIGNVLTIIILLQRAMRSSTNVYLSALAVWDSIVLICTMLLIGLPGMPIFTGYMWYGYAYIVSYIYPLALIAQTATIWLTVSFTVERYIAVCHPLKAATMCTIWRAKVVIIGASVGSTFYNIPRWFEYRPLYVVDADTNATRIIVNPSDFSMNPTYVQIYYSWLYVPILCIIPLLVLSIMNLFLILAVRKSRKQRKNMNVKQSRENNVTIMLVSVVIVFIICQVPALVYNLAYAIDRVYVQSNFGYQVLSVFRNFLVCTNSAINFILYCALGQKFRRIFLHTFFRRCINGTYIPMSGVYQNTTMVSMTSQRRYTSRISDNHQRVKTETLNHSSSTTQTAGTSHSSQESTLLSPTKLSPTRNNHDREVHTYALRAADKKRIKGRPLSHVDSDDEGTLDTCLLPEAEKDMYPLYRTVSVGSRPNNSGPA